ncbi:MAG TPA: class F sortase [Candidatus Saccharimonadales bacterium]|nr:class F sortase [Candidatus Saccharimonadales bacterium]
MKIQKLFQLTLLVSGIAVVAGVGLYLLSFSHGQPIPMLTTRSTSSDKSLGWKFPISKFPLTGSNGKLIAYSSVRDPGGIPQGLPVRLQIPSIGVNTAIEDALITPDGRMDVPAGSVNVAWFSLGPHPGQVGSAVIGGHFGIENGKPFVFYNLDKLKVDDKIFIVDDGGNTLAFVVRAVKSFDRNGDSTTVFTSNDGLAHLNLITCEGIWNQVNGNYPQRLVIFTDAIPAEGAVVVNKKQSQVLTNAKNAQKTTPSPLPTQLVVPTTSAVTLPVVGDSSKNIQTTLPQSLLAAATGLFATPLDGFITTILLIVIGFIIFKFIRH